MTEDLKRLAPHGIRLDDKKHLTVTGVRQIGDFNEQTVVLFIADGRLKVSGENLSLDKLDPDMGEAQISGNVTALQYSDNQPRAKSIAAKLFR
ncbi:MAG: YabP/YqfC family sporulation protein [Clostridia bacterium]|nr:YabP/YqfC family sporulation protein [Clostridia bacterium]